MGPLHTSRVYDPAFADRGSRYVSPSKAFSDTAVTSGQLWAGLPWRTNYKLLTINQELLFFFSSQLAVILFNMYVCACRDNQEGYKPIVVVMKCFNPHPNPQFTSPPTGSGNSATGNGLMQIFIKTSPPPNVLRCAYSGIPKLPQSDINKRLCSPKYWLLTIDKGYQKPSFDLPFQILSLFFYSQSSLASSHQHTPTHKL